MSPLPKYHKIDSVFKRDPDNHHKTFIEGAWARPEFDYLADAMWTATEKVDGTNMRISTEAIGGRTDNAQLHVDLMEAAYEVQSRMAGLEGLTLFGEGYGAGIQKGGGDYRPDKGFILFDVVTVDGIYLHRSDVVDIAGKLGIRAVPVTYAGTLLRMVKAFRDHEPVARTSHLRDTDAEGWVMRPLLELRDRLGARIITKIKGKDYPA